MKRIYILIAFALFSYYSGKAQGNWTQLTGITTGGRDMAGGFGLNIYGYMVGGYMGIGNYTNELWEYDPSSDTWTPRSPMPFGSYGGVCFTAGGRGHYTLGKTTFGYLTELYQYKPMPNNYWLVNTSFPGAGRLGAIAFGIGSKGYVGMGIDQNNTYLTDMYSYEVSTDTWTPVAAFTGPPRSNATAFAIGTLGYVSGGTNGTVNMNDLWVYDPAADSWAQKASLPGAARSGAVSFSIGLKGYIAGGSDYNGNYLTDLWEYDPANDTWTQLASFTGPPREAAIAFNVGALGYLASGSSATGPLADLWSYTPSPVAIEDHANTSSFSIFPNPGKGVFNFSLNGAPPGLYQLKISDIMGRTVHESDLRIMEVTSTYPIDLSDLKPGTYFLSEVQNNHLFRQRLIITE